MWSEVVALARLTRDLPAFLRTPLGVDEAGRRVQRRLATRADSFLAFAERAIFAEPRSPYRRLLAAAGCEAGDLRRLVADEGLEGALTHLAARGVYVTFDAAGRSCAGARVSSATPMTSTTPPFRLTSRHARAGRADVR